METNFEKYKNSLSVEDLMVVVKAMMTPHDAWVALESKNWEKWGNEDEFTKWADVGGGPVGSGHWKSEWEGLGVEEEN